jgi:hypothetical protein
MVASVLLVTFTAVPARAQPQEGDARSILKAMSDYVGSQKTIELTFDSDIEVITPQLEKIQFTNSGEALLSRPDKLRAHRVGGYADVALFLRQPLQQADIHHVWANTIVLSGALLGYNSLTVVRRHLGKRGLIRMFLSPLPEL